MAQRLAALALAGALTAGLTLPAAPAEADDRRRIVSYVVRPGDTATGLAVRFHAWTAELLTLNDLTERSTLYVGQRLRIPVVVEGRRRTTARQPVPRDRVARAITQAADRYGVSRRLALAVAWQESGWRMGVVSSAGAIGAMQVMPGTGEWMSLYVGRKLHLHRLRDNVAAGVMLLRVLRDSTDNRRDKIAAYYQGLGAVRRHGLYQETKAYVANVLALKRMLREGHSLR
ncbi:MAG TPA: transglycosylase SLT domain-containing protein [Nocardioidaceae bacterium]|nr:transglycosylase SLT domain-containing protein [Nocardioidaceae bacterium]